MFIQDIINDDWSVNRIKFTFRGYEYQFIASSTSDRFALAKDARDTLRRSDGRIVEMTRSVLRDYFAGQIKNAELLKANIKIIKEGSNG